MEENKDITKELVKSESNNNSQQIANINSFKSLNLFNEKELAAAENFLLKIMRSDKGGIKSVNDGLAILMRAQSLDIPFATCIEHIHVINGKTGIDIHVVKALLIRAGVTWEQTKRYEPIYEYTDGFNVYAENLLPSYAKKCISKADAVEKQNADKSEENVYVYPVKWYKDFNGNVYKDYQLDNNKFGVALNRNQVKQISDEGKIPIYRIVNQPIDYVTEYTFERNVNGKLMKAISSFSYSEAAKADFFEKDTYKKYPKVLIGHRAFTYGARDIASDALFGCFETTELKIMTGTELNDNDYVEIEEVN